MRNKIDIIAETEHWIALNKPSGLLSIPDREQTEPSLKDFLNEKYGKVFIVHRLDKATSGLILFAKDEDTHKFLSKQFEERTVEKLYTGLVNGTLMTKEGSVDAPIMEHPGKTSFYITHQKGKASLTDYKLLQEFGQYSWMQFQIHTGRTHQIRVHMKHIGHPIVCDELYGSEAPVLLSSVKRKKFKLSKADEEERPLLNRLALHAWKLSFTDVDGKKQHLEAPLSKDLKAMLQQFEKWMQ
ncbi:MAG: RluA family pseudouridine synthase [Chitinophagaceae bacterium]|nr:RluA family pseudouridine synthase [Chitinophagaceae bacterium]